MGVELRRDRRAVSRMRVLGRREFGERSRRDRLGAGRWPAGAYFERSDLRVVDEARSDFRAILRTGPE
jgi:hypothetical protein